jgi:hypothetical protein
VVCRGDGEKRESSVDLGIFMAAYILHFLCYLLAFAALSMENFCVVYN